MQSVKSGESSNENSPEYEVIKIEKIDAPNGTEGENWYSYVIRRSSNSSITGQRRGTLEQVKQYARECADEINQRQGNGGYSMWTTRKNKQPSK
jgi:hypothetical protein